MKKSISEIISALHLGEMTTAEAATSLVKIAKEGGSGALTLVADLALSNENANLVQNIFLCAKDCNLKPLTKQIAKNRILKMDTDSALAFHSHENNLARWEAMKQIAQSPLDAVLLATEMLKQRTFFKSMLAIAENFSDSDDLARAIACAVAHKNKAFMFDLDAAWEDYAGDRTLLLRCVRSVFTA
jgi:hypothetical protein